MYTTEGVEVLHILCICYQVKGRNVCIVNGQGHEISVFNGRITQEKLVKLLPMVVAVTDY